MQHAAQQAMDLARRLGDALKTRLLDLAPEPAKAVIDAVPSVILLLVALFLALVVLRLTLGLLFGGRRGAKASRASGADVTVDSRTNRRRGTKADFSLPPRDPRPGFEAATARGEDALLVGDLSAARANFEEAERIARDWTQTSPGAEGGRALARTQLRLAEVRQKAGDMQGAQQSADQAVSGFRNLTRTRPDDGALLREFAVTLERAGGVAAALGDKAGARRAWEEELSIANRLASGQPGDPSWQRFLAVVHVMIGNLGEADAFTHYDRALRHFEQCERAGALTQEDAYTRDQLRGALRGV